MDLPRLEFLNKYWADYPPLHAMVAAYLGLAPKPKAKGQDFAEVMAMFPETPSKRAPSGPLVSPTIKSESSQHER